jgi:hypothetical protein
MFAIIIDLKRLYLTPLDGATFLLLRHAERLLSFPLLLQTSQDAILNQVCGRAGAARYVHWTEHPLATTANRPPPIAKPTSALIPYRSIAAISSSSSKPASAVTPHNVPGNPGTPPSMSVTGKVRREVPLPSQEGKKGVMQYALYVPVAPYRAILLQRKIRHQ